MFISIIELMHIKSRKKELKMIKLNLDKISTVEKTIHFHNDKLMNMYENVKAFSNAQIIYSELEKRLANDGFRFVNERGGGRCKILVSGNGYKFLFLY